MKTRIILLIAISAIATLSFTLVSTNKSAENKVTKSTTDEPAGGLLSGEQL